MLLGQLMLFCAAVLVALGIAKPLIDLLGIRPRDALIWIASCALCSMIEFKLTVVAIALPTVFFLSGLRWTGGMVRAFFGALLGGVTALAYMAAQRRLGFEPGAIAGVLAAAAASAATRYRRVSLAAGFLALPIALFMLAQIESYAGALLSMPQTELFNAAIASSLSSCLFTAGFQAWRARRRHAELA